MSCYHGLKRFLCCVQKDVCVLKMLACPVPHSSPGNLRCHIFPWHQWILAFFISTKIRLLANFPLKLFLSLNHSRYPAVITWPRYYPKMMIDWLDHSRLHVLSDRRRKWRLHHLCNCTGLGNKRACTLDSTACSSVWVCHFLAPK